MKVIVLGAGVVGTTTAWFLAKSGHEVVVVDRQPNAALETSFANGGQISVSHAEPWANPSAPLKVAKWLLKEDAPLLFRLRADINQWLWGLAFLRECLPWRTRENIIQIVNLGIYSRETLHQLRRETCIENDHLERGILHFYTDPKEFEAAIAPTELMRRYGCDRRLKTTDECIAIEPALTSVREKLAGGTYTPSDESGDAHLFTQRLACRAADKGVTFLYRHSVLRLERVGGTVTSVRVADGEGRLSSLKANAYVVALGSYSPLLLRPLGVRIPIYPAKGYSVTLQVANPTLAPCVSLTDDEYKLVVSRLGNRLRIAGTAELNGYNTELNETRCRAIMRRVEELFPGAGDTATALFWAGLRPATPGNVPLIGPTHYANLYLNTGHGTLGWTHSCGSARALADIIDGRRPDVGFRFLGMRRGEQRA